MNIGKKIISAFVEVTDDPVNKVEVVTPAAIQLPAQPTADNGKFRQHFEQLFAEANLPGPDYYEFSKMTEAMQGINDEKARFIAAFAGLSVQGLDKQKLLETAIAYIKLIESDSANFQSTIASALQDKVRGKQQEIEDKSRRIQELSQEISLLHNQIAALQKEVQENEAKISSSSNGYESEAVARKCRIFSDIEKIKEHIA